MSHQVVQIQKVSKYFGAKAVLKEIDLLVNAKDRLALVGENGAGKSTLIKIVAGKLPADAGRVVIPDEVDVGYLPQETLLAAEDALSIRQYLARAVGQLDAIGRQMRALEAKLAQEHTAAELDALLESYGRLQETFEKRGGYDLDHRIDQVLAGLNLSALGKTRPLATLSGGEKRRVALAGLLLRAPDVLILDEPTNHLDFASLEWLEGFLQAYPGTVLLVSHDRRFLNRVVTLIAELSPTEHSLALYHGNYDFYLQERERAYQKRVQLFEEQQAEIKRLRQLVKQQAFARGGGRPPRDGDRIGYKARIQTSHKTAARTIQDAKNRLAELEERAVKRPSRRWLVNPEFDPADLPSQEVIRLRNVGKAFGDKVLLRGLTQTIRRGERVVLIAPNGTGKSTLLRIITGQIEPDEGVVDVAPQAVVGYLDQEQRTLVAENTVLEEYGRVVAGLEEELRADLHRYALFTGDDVYQKVGSLSEGQRQRLQIAKIAARKANVLLLDEPTNHLDLGSLERLEEAYQTFEGTLLVVSHDRWFIDKIATKIWRLEGGRIVIDGESVGLQEGGAQ